MSVVTQNLKEVGGKVSVWWTRTTYKAVLTGWVCQTKQSPTLHKGNAVNVADIWDESDYSYLGRPVG